MKITDRSNSAVAALSIGFFLLYYFCLPETVQTGDTGEMVVNSYRLGVIHPPGYPLFMWLYSAFLNGVRLSTPYFRAAFFTACLGALVLAVLWRARPMGLASGAAAVLLASLGSFKIYWEYAVLPDVFMLHGLIVALVLVFYFSNWSPRKKFFAITAGLAAGVCNHHTIIFLAPLWGLAARENRSLKDTGLAAAAALVFVAAVYSSLLMVSSGGVLDFRPLESFADLWRHFLRADYGTFQLARDNPDFIRDGIYSLFIKRILTGIPVLVFLAGAGLVADRKDERLRAVGLCLALYVSAFFPLCNYPAVGAYIPILERFFVMPAILVTFLALHGLQALRPYLRPAILNGVFGLAAVSALANLTQFSQLNYSRDTLIEDFAADVLQRAQSAEQGIALFKSDTLIFSAHYLQFAKNQFEGIPVFSTLGITRPHYIVAAQKVRPGISFPDPVTTPRETRERAFVEANFGKVSIVSGDRLDTGSRGLMPLKAGFIVVEKPDVKPVEDLLPVTLRTPLSNFPSFEGRESLKVYNRRCAYHLAHADAAYAAGDFATAAAVIKEATSAFPTCFEAKERECQLLEEQKQLGDAGVCAQEYARLQTLFPEEYEAFVTPR